MQTTRNAQNKNLFQVQRKKNELQLLSYSGGSNLIRIANKIPSYSTYVLDKYCTVHNYFPLFSYMTTRNKDPLVVADVNLQNIHTKMYSRNFKIIPGASPTILKCLYNVKVFSLERKSQQSFIIIKLKFFNSRYIYKTLI